MKGDKKIWTFVLFLTVFIISIIIHNLFLELDFEILRSFILGAGLAVVYWVYN